MTEAKKLGTERIEKILGHVKDLVIVGKKISADKKVDINDLPHVMVLLPLLPEIIQDFKAIGEVIDEGKDFDVAEVVDLIQKINALVKEIEKA